MDCSLPIIAAHCAAAAKIEAAIWTAHDFVITSAILIGAGYILWRFICLICDIVMGASQ